MTLFEKRVYKLIRRIPKGKVATYGEVATALGRPKAYRAVGNALNKNPFAPWTPCHRVVRSDGGVGGYARGRAQKIKILQREGVSVFRQKVGLRKFGWRFRSFSPNQ